MALLRFSKIYCVLKFNEDTNVLGVWAKEYANRRIKKMDNIFLLIANMKFQHSNYNFLLINENLIIDIIGGIANRSRFAFSESKCMH